VRARGAIELNGKPVTIHSPRQALGPIGLAMVPEDRRQRGLLLSEHPREPDAVVISRFSHFGILNSVRGGAWSMK
jgi:ABC-type sugar transport system ATPase subunit